MENVTTLRIGPTTAAGTVVTGSGPDIRALLFGPGPTPRQRAEQDMLAALRRFRLFRAMATAFPLGNEKALAYAARERRTVSLLIAELRNMT